MRVERHQTHCAATPGEVVDHLLHVDLAGPWPHGVDHRLEIRLLDAERPVRHERARVGDRRVRERLADHRDGHAVDLAQHGGREDRIPEVERAHVVGDEVDRALELALDDLADALGAVGELPVPGHHVDTEQARRLDHVLPSRPQRGRRALPRVAGVEQQRAGPARVQTLDERGEMRETPDPPIRRRRAREVQMRERVCLARAGGDTEVAQQPLADEMGRSIRRSAHAEVGAGLAVIRGDELRVAVREVQQAHVAERRRIVERVGCRLRASRMQRESRDGRRREKPDELASRHATLRRCNGRPILTNHRHSRCRHFQMVVIHVLDMSSSTLQSARRRHARATPCVSTPTTAARSVAPNCATLRARRSGVDLA